MMVFMYGLMFIEVPLLQETSPALNISGYTSDSTLLYTTF